MDKVVPKRICTPAVGNWSWGWVLLTCAACIDHHTFWGTHGIKETCPTSLCQTWDCGAVLTLKKSCFWNSKTTLFETVFESKQNLIYVGFYRVLSFHETCWTLTSSLTVAKKYLKSNSFSSFCYTKKHLFFSFKNTCFWDGFWD